MIETKVKVGTGAGALAGLVVWALVSYVPAFRSGVPQPLADAIPFILTAIGNFAGGYLAPHTHRPEPAALPPGTYGNMNVTSPGGGPVTSTVMTGGHPSPPLRPAPPPTEPLRVTPPPDGST